MSEGPVEINAPRIVAFDVESTGTNPESDRIVELCLMTPEGRCRTFRVNPGVAIPPEATRIHGIRDEDVRDAPPFAQIAPQVQAWVEGAVLLGYNSRSFDTPMLHAELRRAGQPGLDLDAVREIDVLRVWSAVEPRTLSGAAQRWLGEAHEGAHQAREDVRATLAVWRSMQGTLGLTHAEAIQLTKPAREIDRAGKFVLNERNEVVFNFGLHQGKPVAAVERRYLEWMAGAEFPSSTKALVQQLMLHGGDLPEAAAMRQRR